MFQLFRFDFSEPYHHYSTPRGNGYERPIIILTNRSCYSATSHFVTMAKEFPKVIGLGDKTGGGAGLPMELPGLIEGSNVKIIPIVSSVSTEYISLSSVWVSIIFPIPSIA